VRTAGRTWSDFVQPAPPNPQPYRYIPADWPKRWRWVACACLDAADLLSRDERKLLRRITVYRNAPSAQQLHALHAIADRVLGLKTP
jgi:hypothetical protein